jgi:hypothetical protein
VEIYPASFAALDTRNGVRLRGARERTAMRHIEVLPPTEDPIPPTLRTVTPEDAARATLRDATDELGRTEVRVLTRIAERLRTSTRARGALGLLTPSRAFRNKDARREIDEALVFLACAWIKAETLETMP